MCKQEPNETVDAFLTALHALAEHRNHGPFRCELIRDRNVMGLADTRLSDWMQMEKNLDLERAVNMARQSQEIKKQPSALRCEASVMQTSVSSVDRVIKNRSRAA